MGKNYDGPRAQNEKRQIRRDRFYTCYFFNSNNEIPEWLVDKRKKEATVRLSEHIRIARFFQNRRVLFERVLTTYRFSYSLSDGTRDKLVRLMQRQRANI